MDKESSNPSSPAAAGKGAGADMPILGGYRVYLKDFGIVCWISTDEVPAVLEHFKCVVDARFKTIDLI